MKNKKLFLIILLLTFLSTIVGVLIYFNNNTANKTKKGDEVIGNNKYKKEKKEKCSIIDGGSFNLIFNTNGGENISSMSVCIACSPDSYENIPIPRRQGYSFDGWYYDKDLKNKIDFTNTKDFRAVQEKDKNGCIIGYKNIEIFAKWNKI